MTVRKPVAPRWVLSAAATAALVAVAAVPARADIPAAGTVFQLKTAFDGTMLCVSSTKKELAWTLVPCDKEDASQHWKSTANGNGIKSVATGECLENESLIAKLCKHREPTANPWQQDRQGRVWRQGDNSITRTFLMPLKHNSYGNILSFGTLSDGTTPESAGLFAFDSVPS
ncbi:MULTISPECIES: hypothetical protein [unclassified Streptomyces]|uniref:hypothetical protein n=1 Tax=unclassified Streptomyces TaxID=2593676 RepID=UPI00368BF91A